MAKWMKKPGLHPQPIRIPLLNKKTHGLSCPHGRNMEKPKKKGFSDKNLWRLHYPLYFPTLFQLY